MKLSKQKLRWAILGLCLLAAIRVFVFAAAFPFFNNVDEQAHVDLVVKYAHAKLPRSIEPFASDAALCFAVYSTPEYFVKPEQYGGQYPPPNWLLPREQLQKVLDDEIPFWESRLNHESGEPPLYYALAGGWMNVGHIVGLRGLPLLYWVRFLSPRNGSLRPRLITLGVFLLSLAVPLGIWLAWNHHNFGDLTATKSKIELLGWTRKPFSEWWSHPIFTLNGITEFWLGLIASFWRGEFVWHLQRMASTAADAFYAVSSAIIILATGVLLLRRRSNPGHQPLILAVALLSFLSIVAFLVVLSIGFDFGQCPYPSREHPYFTSGRLLDAAAIPFFLFFVYAIDRFTGWTKQQWLRWTLLSVTVLVAVVSQLEVNAPAFSSRYNFFHRQTP